MRSLIFLITLTVSSITFGQQYVLPPNVQNLSTCPNTEGCEYINKVRIWIENADGSLIVSDNHWQGMPGTMEGALLHHYELLNLIYGTDPGQTRGRMQQRMQKLLSGQ